MTLKSVLKNLISFLIVTFFLISALMYPKTVSEGILSGMDICLKLLIPSLFFFMVISAMIVRFGIAQKIGFFMEPITKFLFGLPGSAFSALFLGLIGGYPTGAKTTKTLFETGEITKKQTEKIILFCFGSGPAFVITMVGGTLLKNTFLGVLMFSLQVISTLILGILLKFFSKESDENQSRIFSKENTINIPEAVVLSCSDAAETMFNMCALVVAFSVFLNILEIFNFSSVFLKMFLEITIGCTEGAKLGISPEILVFGLTFGGICVHFQVLSVLKSGDGKNLKISYLKFFICRIFCACVSSGLLFFTLKALKNTNPVFFTTTVSNSPQTGVSGTIFGSLAIVFMCLNFCLAEPFEKMFYQDTKKSRNLKKQDYIKT